MKVLCTEQGTKEWRELHAGRITASKAHVALMDPMTKGYKNLVRDLADDLDGIPNFESEEPPPWFTDGLYYESWARGWYSFNKDVDVEQTGLVVHDAYDWLGCSPDGLVGDDGLLEIKYRKSLRTFKQHAALRANNSVIAQVQTQLFVTGRKWCDYVNYWRSDDQEVEQGFCERIEVDQPYIDNTLLPAFLRVMKDVDKLAKERGQHYNRLGLDGRAS